MAYIHLDDASLHKVRAVRIGNLMVHRSYSDPACFVLTHTPTGYRLVDSYNRRLLVKIARMLMRRTSALPHVKLSSRMMSRTCAKLLRHYRDMGKVYQ
jgi:hypothetical protein